MAASEVLELVPASAYARIKAQDENPIFRAYVIGHEGEARPQALGKGQIISQWFKSAITKLYEKLMVGINIFHDHNLDNSHEGRTPIGELVGKALKTVAGKLSALAIIYIRPEYKHLPLDVASIEADVDLMETSKNVYEVDVSEVTGIALGNSSVNRPGFPGATLLAQVQGFEKYHSKFNKGSGKMETVDEVREFIKVNKIKPTDLFSVDNLTEEPMVKEFFKDDKSRAVTAEWEHRTRTDKKLNEMKADYEKQISDLKAINVKTAKEAAKVKVPEIVTKLAKDRKLDESQVKFINARIGKFEPKEADKLEAELNTHLDAEIDEYKKTAEIFGVKQGQGQGQENKGEADKTGNTGAGADQNSQVPPENKYLDPKTNPFIPQI
jgi:hypothetical protein